MIGKYIKKPVEVEAMQYTKENKVPFLKFVGENMMMKVCYTDTGEMFYPCKEDIFLETYEKIEE